VEVVASLYHHACVARQQAVAVVVLRVVMTAGGMRVILGEGPLVGATCLLHGVVVVVVAAGGDVWGCMSLVWQGGCLAVHVHMGGLGDGSPRAGVCLVAYGVCLGGFEDVSVRQGSSVGNYGLGGMTD